MVTAHTDLTTKPLLGNHCLITVLPESLSPKQIENLMHDLLHHKWAFMFPVIQTNQATGELYLQGRKTVFGHNPDTTTTLKERLKVLAAAYPMLELGVSYATNLQKGFVLPEVTLLVKGGVVVDTQGFSPHIGHPAPILTTNT